MMKLFGVIEKAMTSAIVTSLLACVCIVPFLPHSVFAATTCSARLAHLKQELAREATVSTLEASVLSVVDAVECGPEDATVAKSIFAERLLELAIAARKTGGTDQSDALIAKAAEQHVSWRAAQAYGEILNKKRNYPKAAEYFQQAINLLSEAGSASSVRREEIRQLTLKAEEAYHLAAAGTEQRKGADGVLVRSVTRSGTPGGVLGRAASRGIEAVRLPMPILFKYDSAEFTSVGEQAAQELLDLLKSSPPRQINVIGHTDRKGGSDYNQKLSERRAARVALYLRENGVQSNFTVSGKGMSSPRQLSDDHSYTQDQVDELNRRVEFDWN